MKVLLIDADSKIPNLPLMKLSTWHKNKGDEVVLKRANLPYYPGKKKLDFIAPEGYDKKYCSVIFEGNKGFIKGDGIVFGGTGIDLTTNLPPEIESCEPDYSLYPENDCSYGFITRGCIRSCSFCKVPKKEGWIKKVASVQDIVRHKKVKFMDNNFLAYEGHKEIMSELISSNIKCQFNQGLDIRLLDEENSRLLKEIKPCGDILFAFDNWKLKHIIEEKAELLRWRKPFQIKFFVYVRPEMPTPETVNRINWLKENEFLPFVMRDLTCWESPDRDFFTDIAAYCNQPSIFRKMGFDLFLEKRHTSGTRIKASLEVWNRYR